MTRFAVLTSTALAAIMLGATPAAADYTIDTDAAFPSVVYINFDPDTMPKVLMAPSARDLGLKVIDGGAMPTPSNPDQNAPDQKAEDDNPPDDNPDDGDDGAADQTSSTGTFEQRAEDQLNEIASDPQALEDAVIDYEVEDRLREETERLLQ